MSASSMIVIGFVFRQVESDSAIRAEVDPGNFVQDAGDAFHRLKDDGLRAVG